MALETTGTGCNSRALCDQNLGAERKICIIEHDSRSRGKMVSNWMPNGMFAHRLRIDATFAHYSRLWPVPSFSSFFSIESLKLFINHYYFNTMSLRYATTVAARTALTQRAVINAAPQLRYLSSNSSEEKSPGIFGRMQNAFTERQERKQREGFSEQLEKMSNSEVWSISDFQEDMSKTVNSWRTKVPGMSNLSQVKTAKSLYSIAQAIIEEIGADSTAAKLTDMSRIDKLKVSIKSGASVEEINMMLSQFQAVDVMHSVVRRRKLDGKAIPNDEAAMRSILQKEGLKNMSKTQKKAMKDAQMKKGMRGMGRVRR